jgi:pilus assembly protein FimV
VATDPLAGREKKDKTRDIAMIRVRKLVLAIAAATSLTSGMVHALGLGEISLQSALNQPLNADIDLLEVRDLDKTEIIPRLASAEDFSKAGIERGYFLSNLKFTPVIMPNGKSMIHVTSTKPVREPYINFLVEVIWPSGRVLREYTLLLDPPMYSPETAAVAPRLPVAAPASVSRNQVQPNNGPFKVGSLPGSKYSESAASSQSRPAAAKPATLEGQYKTGKNDTLWEIARRVKGGGSLNQTMLAIQDLNPDAFVAGNINRLKSGQVLRLPDDAQINARSRTEASAAVAEQNVAWREGRSLQPVTERQLDATKRNAAGAAPAEVETKDSLRLVAADVGKAASNSEKGADGDSKALSNKLAVTQESLDTSRRQSDELSGRVTDLQGQLEKLQKLIELKDSQLAQLQADLAAQEKLSAATTATTATTATASAAADAQPEAASAVTSEAAPAGPSDTAAAPDEDAVEEQTEVLAQGVVDTATQPEETPAPVQQPVAEPVVVAEPEPVAAAKPVEPVVPVQIVTETVVEEVPEPVSMLDEVLGNPLLLGAGGAGLLVILLGLMAMARRNAQKEEDEASGAPFLDGSDDNSFADEIDIPEDSFGGLDDGETEYAEDSAKKATADALGEADIYIAYGKFNQAAELLQGAINDEPNRSDLQLKLLEVTAEMGDREGFLRQAAELEEIGSVDAELDQIKARYPAMVAAGFAAGVGAVVADSAAADLDIDDLISDAPSADQSLDEDDAFDLSLEELEADDAEPMLASSPAEEQNLDDFSLDIDFDKPETKAADDFDFDLSLDELADDSDEFEPKPATTVDDDFSDFDLDLGSDLSSSSDSAADFSLDADSDLEFEVSPAAIASADNETILDVGADTDIPAVLDLSMDADDLQSIEPIEEELEAKADALADNFTAEGMMDSLEADELSVEGEDEDFDFLSGTDETATKLDLARAYIDMGDAEGARDILEEVVSEGSEAQQQEARELIGKLA